MTSYEYQKLLSMLVEILQKVTELADDRQKELLTPAEVCKRLKICKRTYHNHVAAGLFDQVRVSGRVYVRRCDIERLIDDGKL